MNKTTSLTSVNSKRRVNRDPLNYLLLKRATPTKREANERSIDFKEIYSHSNDLQSSNQAARCLDCGNPYCEWKCPLHNYIPNWLNLVAREEHQQAGELMYETNPLPEICGRVCPQDRLCEQACTINTGFGAVTIGAIEKSVTDKLIANKWRPDLSLVKSLDKKVAIIGAGPAGLACADQLARNGVKAVVYDRYPEIGGLLTFGIPGFKLEKEVMLKRRFFLQDIGVEFKLNTMVVSKADKTASNDKGSATLENNVQNSIDFEQLERQYDSVFLAMGTYTSVQSGLPGEQLKGVIKALDYLIGNVNQIENYGMSDYPYYNLKDQEVIIVGGGDTAMDCVRTAVRQGAKNVTCVYRRSEVLMPGSPREVSNAKEEGVKFLFDLSPVAIEQSHANHDTSAQLVGLRVQQSKQQVDTKTKATKLVLDPSSERTLNADTIIVAFGFKASPADWFKSNGIDTKDNGLVTTKKDITACLADGFSQSNSLAQTNDSLQTSNEKIFAGGDMVRGADLVVTAIADGIKAAHEIIDGFNAG